MTNQLWALSLRPSGLRSMRQSQLMVTCLALGANKEATAGDSTLNSLAVTLQAPFMKETLTPDTMHLGRVTLGSGVHLLLAVVHHKYLRALIFQRSRCVPGFLSVMLKRLKGTKTLLLLGLQT